MMSALRAVTLAVGQAFGGLTEAEVRSKSKLRGVVRARHVAMYLARAELGLSYPEIAKQFGYLDHSAVMHGVNVVVELVKAEDVRILEAIRAGEDAYERWKSGDLSELRRRRLVIAGMLRELVAEAQEIDRKLGNPLAPGVDREPVAAE